MQSQFPEPREFQVEAQAALRKGFQNGHRCQVLMAPTGAGKTYMAMLLIKGALDKGKRALFVCDRTTLIDQTSAVADAYGLSNHGVIQADHWRRNTEPFQICSVQTIARRGWLECELMVWDECHCMFKTCTDHIPNISAAVIGLSATPFADGLGDLFSNLVNAATMDRLVREGILVPLRIFSCTPTDMKGAETSGGEWTDRAAGERGLKIVGDVVSEWCKLGENRKTICFGATIAHCEELVRQFGEVGVNARLYTSETRPRERAEILQEYRKHDSQIRVLASVEALVKGFDVPDISCCAEGSQVLTDRGLVAIEKLLLTDRVWDGIEFVNHDGPIYQGIRSVITYSGLTATADHLVHTAQGWTTFGKCFSEKIAITTSGLGREAVPEYSDLLSGCVVERECAGQEKKTVRVSRMCRLWEEVCLRVGQILGRSRQWMLGLQGKESCSELAGKAHKGNATALHECKESCVPQLRWKRYSISVFFRACCRRVDQVESWIAATLGIGSHRQRWALRTWESSVGVPFNEQLQHAAGMVGGQDTQVQVGTSRNPLCGQNAAEPVRFGIHGGTDYREIPSSIGQTKRRVWDILNCGPRHRFTCEGLLVHNCLIDCRPLRKSLSTAMQMWGRGMRCSPATGKQDCLLLDHSGNICRFARDFEDIYFNGLSQLKMGQKLDKTIRRDEEDKTDPKGCPRCGHKPFYKHCTQCGYQRPAVSNLETEAGIMREITIGSRKLADDHRHLWEQLCTYARKHSPPEKQNGRAYHLFREIAGVAPPREWRIETTPDVPILHATANKIRSRNIAFIKSRR